jgi:phosphopantetheine adenylyltransferase
MPGSETAMALGHGLESRSRDFLNVPVKINSLPYGLPTIPNSRLELSNYDLRQSKPHHSVAVGGTFDHLHIGHKLLLTFTIFLASPRPSTSPRKITIGITTDNLLANKKHASVLESWETRQQRTAEFIESILFFGPPSLLPQIKREEFINNPGPNGKIVRHVYTPVKKHNTRNSTEDTDDEESPIEINYTSINDPFGPTITDEDISALVISAETRKGGDAVNEKRREKGWKDLEVFEVDVLDTSPGVDEDDEDDDDDDDDGKKNNEKAEEKKMKKEKIAAEGFQSKISSTEIRRRIVELEAAEGGGGGGGRGGKEKL